MNIALASTWHPRADVARLHELLPQLGQVYRAMVVAVRPETVDRIRVFPPYPGLTLFLMSARGWGRYQAIQKALTTSPDHIHYADLDSLLYWVERNPQEWRETVAELQHADCLVIGRTARAFETCPQAIQQTEEIINRVFSCLLGETMDFGLGNRGYSRRAAQCILEHSAAGHWGDAEWPVLVRQADYSVAYRAVDGIDWIPSDPDGDYLLDAATRRRLAEAYDRDPAHWATRVQVAQEILQQGLALVRHGVGWP